MSDFESGSTLTFPMPGAASRMVVGDFDGDGDADILYQTGANGTAFQYARSNGDGTFSILALGSSPFGGLTLPDNIGGSYYAGDFDGDGDTDVVAAVANTTGSYFRNDGGVLTAQSSTTVPAPAAPSRMVTGDFDADGDEDILYQTAGNGTAFQYARSNGNGTFTIVAQASSPFSGVTLLDHNGSNYLAGDFDGDGDTDLIATPNGSTGEYYRNDNGTFVEGATGTFPQPAAGGRMTAGDFDADGDADIIYQTGANGTALQYARSNGDGTFTLLALAASPFTGLTLPDHNGGNYYAADFDGDGDTDLLAGVNSATGSYFYQVGKPPEIVSSTPGDNALGVAVGANITITFDEAVTKGSGNILIVRSDGTVIETISVNSAQVSGSGTTWTIDPSVTLAGLTGYAIQFQGGTFRDVDLAEFAGIDDMTTFNFTTAVANTPPVVAANTGLTLNEGASGTITAARLDYNDAQQADTAITYAVTTLATNGTLRLNGVGLGLNGTFTQSDINNGLVTYLHDGGETTSASFGFSVSDGAGGSVTSQTFAFTVTPVNDKPTSTSLDGDIASWTESGAAVALDVGGNAAILDVDSANFGGGTLTVDITGGEVAAQDVLSIAAVGGVTSDATTVSVGGVQIATYTGGSAGTPLVLTFDADATPAAVQALVRALRYDNTGGEDPTGGDRTLTWTLVDGDGTSGGGADTATATTTVQVASVNDEPAGGDGTIALGEDGTHTFSLSDFDFSDTDGDSLAAVVLTTLPGNGSLYLNGVAITAAGTAVTPADITGGLLTFKPDADENGSGYTSFTFQVRDDGGTANSGQNTDQTPNTITVNVTAINDAPVNTVGATVNATEDDLVVVLSTTGAEMSVSDVDAPGAIAYSLTVTDGVLNIRTDVVGGITAAQIQASPGTGNGTTTINIAATAGQINATLAASNALTYTPTANFNGAATLQVYVNDGGQTGLDTNPVSILDPVSPGMGAITEEDVDARSIVVAAVDDAAVAQNDDATTDEVSVLTGGAGALFANNGSGVDGDVDGPALSISAVNGSAGNVGTQITLTSGALLTVNADGSYSYDPNGAFDYLIDGATAAATGALNVNALDSFTYTLTDGGTATVTVTVNGLASAGDELWGSAINNPLTGTAGVDYFDLSQGGEDTASGLAGEDGFYFGAAFTGGDTVDGGAGINDQIGLEGDYTGANALVLGATTIANIEVIGLLAGSSYDLTMHDGNVAAGGKLDVYAGALGTGDSFTFDGSAETDGWFRVFGGQGTDIITTGAGNDGIYFGPDRFDPTVDRVDGGAGTNDQLALDGNYVGLTLNDTAIQNIEVIVLLKGVPGDLAQYSLTVDASLVGAGETLTIWGAKVETAMTISANGVNGHVKIFGGTANDGLEGGQSSDWLWGGLGSDMLVGGGDADTFFYQDAAESSAGGFDRIFMFNDLTDKIDLDGRAVTGFAGPLSGALDSATIGTQLEAAATTLGVGQALEFTVNAGDLVGKTFLLIDGNDTAGYQANGDFLIWLQSPLGPVDNLGMFV